MKRSMENKNQYYLDKQKFLVRFPVFEGYLNYLDSTKFSYEFADFDRAEILNMRDREE